jgi:hypothetical protein
MHGSYILARPKKDTFTQTTNYIISMAEPDAYAMTATLANSTKVTLSTNIITKGQIRHQIATLNLTTHTRSILGRTYAQLLADIDITQLNNNLAPLQYNQTKGFIGRPIDTIAWAKILLAHTDVLQAYEEGLQEQNLKDPPPTKPTNRIKERTHCH